MKHSTRGRNASKASPSPMYNCRATWLQLRGRGRGEGEETQGTNWQLKSLLMGFMFTTSIERKPLFAFGPKMTPSSSSSSSSNYTAKRKAKKDRRRGRRAEGGAGEGKEITSITALIFPLATVNKEKMKGKEASELRTACSHLLY